MSVLMLLPSLLVLGSPPSVASVPEVSPIIGGERVDDDEWVAVVRIEDRCTGTLVHPEVVVYAGHCGQDVRSITVGAREVRTAVCLVHPEAGSLTGHDLAVCVLEGAVDVLPIPIATGDVVGSVVAGTPALLVGYGRTGPEEPAGVKHAVWSEVQSRGREWVIGREDAGTCAGDSGGPALVRGGDGGWWVLGVLSGGDGACGAGYYTALDVHVGWLEDVTQWDLVGDSQAWGEVFGEREDRGGGCRIGPARGAAAWPLLVLLSLLRPARPRRVEVKPHSRRNPFIDPPRRHATQQRSMIAYCVVVGSPKMRAALVFCVLGAPPPDPRIYSRRRSWETSEAIVSGRGFEDRGSREAMHRAHVDDYSDAAAVLAHRNPTKSSRFVGSKSLPR